MSRNSEPCSACFVRDAVWAGGLCVACYGRAGTTALPGTEAKIVTMIARMKSGHPLFHPGDRRCDDHRITNRTGFLMPDATERAS